MSSGRDASPLVFFLSFPDIKIRIKEVGPFFFSCLSRVIDLFSFSDYSRASISSFFSNQLLNPEFNFPFPSHPPSSIK